MCSYVQDTYNGRTHTHTHTGRQHDSSLGLLPSAAWWVSMGWCGLELHVTRKEVRVAVGRRQWLYGSSTSLTPQCTIVVTYVVRQPLYLSRTVPQLMCFDLSCRVVAPKYNSVHCLPRSTQPQEGSGVRWLWFHSLVLTVLLSGQGLNGCNTSRVRSFTIR